MKRAGRAKKPDRKGLPGQLDLFGGQARSDSANLSGSGANHGQTTQSTKASRRSQSAVASRASKGQDKVSSNLDLVDTQAAARKMGLGVSTLEKMRTQRRGPPFIKLARSLVRYRLVDLDAWISSRVRE